MTCKLTIFLALALLGVVSAKIDYEEAEKHFNICKEETGAEENFEDVVKKEKIPTSDKGMCLVECMFRQKGIYDKEGKYNTEGTRKYFSKVFAHLPDNIEKSVKITEECHKMDVEGLDKCEAAVKYLTCSRTKAVQQNIHLKD
uniref:Odorant-binding protein 12 n=1 Tax=Matsumurasca onukii TaxID=2912585 RepID=A0A343WGW8_MATON|nr:odorant-binding protein 12 [Matsumurasca onukii]